LKTENGRPTGLLSFAIIWIGQAISLLGTSMSNFALTVWAYQLTGSATALALVGFFYTTPLLLCSPIAGALVDRSNRKVMMMLSDLAAGTATLGILILNISGSLQIWHLYVAAVIAGTFQTFQWPAYSAAITMIVPKEHYARANAMNELAGNSSGVFAPLLAGALLGVIGLTGILLIDVVTFVFAVGALLLVHIPQPKISLEGQQSKGSLWKEAIFGFRYIFQRPSLLGLQIIFLMGNFFNGIGFAVWAPMILARTDNNALIFGSVETVGAIGGVVGGIAMSAWGGPRRRVHGVLLGWMLSGVLGTLLAGLGRALPIWATAMFFNAFLVPLINSSNQAIWQAKVPPDLQGRVFAIRRLIAWFVSPLSMLIAGPLADFVLEPPMRQESALSQLFGWLVGTGPGSGMALMFIFSGMMMALVGLAGYLVRTIREAESILPDHEASA
jgi:MFS family permease